MVEYTYAFKNGDFTSVPTRESYFYLPYDCYKNRSKFLVAFLESVEQLHNLQHQLGPRSKLPDQYVQTIDSLVLRRKYMPNENYTNI